MELETGVSAFERIGIFVQRHGASTVIALGMVIWLMWASSGTLGAIKDTLDRHVLESGLYLRQICLNTATTESQRAGCLWLERGR